MAYHTARPRHPFLDESMNRAIAKRGMELAGLLMLAAAAGLGVLLWTHMSAAPDILATGLPEGGLVAKALAGVSAGLLIGFGLGAWVCVVFAGVWGLRLLTHTGAGRFANRVLPLPAAPLVAAVHLSSYAAPSGWPWGDSPGLGGTFGDVILGALINMVPDTAMVTWFKILSAASGVALLGVLALVLGLTWTEMRRIGAVLRAGVALILQGFGRGAGGLGAAGRGVLALVMSGLSRSDTRYDPAAPHPMTAPEPGWTPQAPPAQEVPPAQYPSAASPPRADWTRAAPVAVVPKATPRPRDHGLTTLHSTDPYAVPVPNPGLLAWVNSRRAAEAAAQAPETAPPEMPAAAPEKPRENFIKQAILRRNSRAPAPQADQPPVAPPPPAASPVAPIPGMRAEPPLMGHESMPQEDLPGLRPDETTAPDLADTISAAVARAQDRSVATMRSVATPVPDDLEALARQPVRPKPTLSSQARAEAQPSLFLDESADIYAPPPLGLLSDPTVMERPVLSREALEANAKMLEDVLSDYGVKGEIVNFRAGPVVTLYELEPAPGLKASRVIGLADDIARSMSALSARVSTVPGRSVIGIELPNVQRETVLLRELLSGRDFGDSTLKLPLALGKDIGGESVVANLAKMPHLLIAGTTGSGKSVAINTMILSLLYKLSPEDCRMIMIDPKMLELSVYDGIPHLLSPVVTDPKKAVVALKWVVGEMEERYRKMSKMGVRNIDGYNTRVRETLARGEMFSRTVQTGFDEDTGEPIFETEEFEPRTLPYIVVVVDEMADLMMVAGKEIEACIQRLAQMARASGIHLIMATQRPSVDVITGTIKANFPTRISFQVTSKVDSRTILGEQGAEQLLGMGDMLYMAGGGKITRVHGPFVSDTEVEEVVSHLKSYGPPEYVGGVVDGPDEDVAGDVELKLGLGGNTNAEDALYDQAVAIAINDRKCSTSYIQRKLAIGYNKAARLVERMEDEGIVSAANHVGKREVLMKPPGQG